MIEKKDQDQSTQLYLDSGLSKEERDYYKSLHKGLAKMKKNQINIQGVDFKVNDKTIISTTIIRSTVEKEVNLKPAELLLLHKDLGEIARKREEFLGLGSLKPNTAKVWQISFEDLKLIDFKKEDSNRLSIGFAVNMEHRLDLSDLDEEMISQAAKEEINRILKRLDLKSDNLILTGLAANFNENKDLETTLLISNGSNNNLEIKQLPLELYDGNKNLSARGIFKFENLNILANTTKPISLVFPRSSLLREDMDLSSWSIVHKE